MGVLKIKEGILGVEGGLAGGSVKALGTYVGYFCNGQGAFELFCIVHERMNQGAHNVYRICMIVNDQ
jgi:hypothetical protein